MLSEEKKKKLDKLLLPFAETLAKYAPISAPSFTMCFPLISRIMAYPPSFTAQDAALQLTSLHCGAGQPFPWKGMWDKLA